MPTSFDSSSTSRGCPSAIATRSSSACMGPDDTVCASGRPSPVRGTRERLGPESFDAPGRALAREAEPAVQAVLASLPELDRFGVEPVPAPVRREWDVLTRKPLRDLGDRPAGLLPRADRAALPGGPGAESRLARPRPEVLEGLRVVHPRGRTGDGHLPVALAPQEGHSAR